MRDREYKMYVHTTEPDPQGFYKADFVGQGKGHISSGAQVISNTTGGEGNLTGYISPQITAIFQFIRDRDVFISTDGTAMTFQSSIGENDLSFIKGFLEYVLRETISNIEGNEYQGLNMKKAYIVKFQRKDGKEMNATMTNKVIIPPPPPLSRSADQKLEELERGKEETLKWAKKFGEETYTQTLQSYEEQEKMLWYDKQLKKLKKEYGENSQQYKKMQQDQFEYKIQKNFKPLIW